MFYKVLVISLITIVAEVDGAIQRRDLNQNCTDGALASFSGDKCWLFNNMAMNFIEAAQYCRVMNGNLTSIHDAFDNIYLAGK